MLLEGLWKGAGGDIMLVTCAADNGDRPYWAPRLEMYVDTFPDYLIEFEMLEGMAGPGGSTAFQQRFPRGPEKAVLYLYALGSTKKSGVVSAVYTESSYLYRYHVLEQRPDALDRLARES